MTETAPTLFPAPPVLTPRQAHAYTLIQAADHDGLTAEELGAAMHAHAGKHARGDRCQFCGREGRSIATSKALKVLVKRKKGGGYVPRDRKPARAESSQTNDFPPGF